MRYEIFFSIVFISFCFCVKEATCQKQASRWIFGNNQSMDFNFTTPALTSGWAGNAPEGSASMADAAGNLIFYSNGEVVRNRNKQLMHGGETIRGSKHCQQAALIIPNPGNTSQYYLFTLTGASTSQPGLYFHIIDMSLQGGNGQVISKDNFLMYTIEEKLTAAFHANDRDSWIITFHEGKIFSFLVSASGVGESIASGDGFIGLDDKKGAMKVSPDGTRLAVARTEFATQTTPFVELYSFDRKTGTVLSRESIPLNLLPNSTRYLYGLSFSPNGKIIYVSTFDPTRPVNVINVVYGLNTQTKTLEARFVYSVDPASGTGIGQLGGGLQLGPDKRLYFLFEGYLENATSLWVFNCPNDSTGIVRPVADFSGPGFRGLPNFNEMIFSQPDPAILIQAGDDLATCSRQSIRLNPLVQNGLIYSWSPSGHLDQPATINPTFVKKLVGTTPEKFNYVLTAQRTGCRQAVLTSDTLQITVMPEPQAPLIKEPDHVCQNQLAGQRYSVDSLPGFQYHWEILGGNFTTRSDRKNIGVDWSAAAAERQVTIAATNTYGCRGDKFSLPVEIKPLPPVPPIQGSKFVCPSAAGIEYWLAPPDPALTYQWMSAGGALVSASTLDTIRVNWEFQNPDASVSVEAKDVYGCSSTNSFPVRINTQIKPEIPVGNELICYNKKSGNVYSVFHRPGSVYQWLPSLGHVVMGQGTNKVVIDWPAVGNHYLEVSEINTTVDTVCFGSSDQLKVHVYKDSSDLQLISASLTPEDGQLVTIKWKETHPSFEQVLIDKRVVGDPFWITAGSTVTNALEYTDVDTRVGTDILQYRLTAQNACDELLEPASHNLVLLESSQDETDRIELTWSHYKGWPREVDRYEIYRKIDGESGFHLFATVDGTSNEFVSWSAAEAFSHTFYIVAHEEGSSATSTSNTINLKYDHPIVVPNVFTPNGDGYNDSFIIPKINLYPDNEIFIINQWGSRVFSSQRYQGDWTGENLSAGIYYYQLTIPSRAMTFTGWVHIVR